jgi:flagellar protein FlaG
MTNTAPIPANVPDVVPAQPAQTNSSAQPAPATTPTVAASQTPDMSIENQSDLRLVIEEDKASGSYVYKTVDPRTGKVISQVPREQLLQMKDDAAYTPGSIVNARS